MRPRMAESSRYTLPTNRMMPMIATPAPFQRVPQSMANPRQLLAVGI